MILKGEGVGDSKYAIGIDVGATNLKLGIVGASGDVIAHKLVPLGEKKSPGEIVSLIAGQSKELAGRSPKGPIAAGCGIPGIVDFESGIIIQSPNLPQWRDVPARDEIAKALGLPTIVDNDANIYALGEQRMGAGRGHNNLVLLTLGTGIGGGLILDGDIFHGDVGFAGEVGHIVVERDGVPCGCGGRGCLERYAASHGFATHASRLSKKERERLLAEAGVDIEGLSAQLVARLAGQGNGIAGRLWKEFGLYLGVGIATLINILGVTTFVIGGGIAKSWDLFIGPARDEIARHTYARNCEALTLVPAALGDNAGVIGAALEAISVN